MHENSIQKFGINKCTKKSSEFFSQFSFSYNINLENTAPSIKQLISIIVDFDIDDFKVVDTIKAVSEERTILHGKKLFVLLKFKFKILYMADNESESVHVIEKECYNGAYIAIPERLEGTDIYSLIKLNLLIPKVYVEDLFLKLLGKKSIRNYIFVYIELKFIDTYELCFSGFKNKNESCVFLSYADGRNITCILDDGNKNIYPEWSPSGKKIAFLSDEYGKTLLFTYDLSTEYIEKIVNEWEFKVISGFSWVDKSKIVFSGVVSNTEELYIIDITNYEVKRITYGNELIKSHNPKVSLDGKKIIFTKSNTQLGVSELWIMNSNGIESRVLLRNSNVSKIAWLPHNENIIYVLEERNQGSKIILLNVETRKSRILVEAKGSIKNMACNLNKNYIAYIEDNLITSDIVVFNMDNDNFYNITRNSENVNLRDIIWNIEGNKIYYTSDEIGNCNIYSIEIETLYTQQLTNINARSIKMMYRPRIV